jgi:signal transduction histidine kinase
MLIALDPLHPVVPLVVWAARALTFFNVLVLLWLGLTILLNAERRHLATWLTGGGLLLGGACSVARASAQTAQPIELFGPIDIWWRASWLPFAGAAYLWTVVLIWYAGRLRTRVEWRSLLGLTVLGLLTCVLLLAARPPEPDVSAAAPVSASVPLFESLSRTLSRLWRRPPTFEALAFETGPGDARLALASYLTFILLCIGVGLNALYRPASPDRFMGELAFRRARPWLLATSLVTLGLSLVVGIGVTGVALVTPPVLLDFLGAGMLSAHVVLLGQAIVSYELFTGNTLPRRGLARYWRNTLILGAGFGGLLAISLGLPLDQSYRLQLALVIVAVFYALLCWRSFAERERSLEQLRPFVASERLVDHLTLPPEHPHAPSLTLGRGEASDTNGIGLAPPLRGGVGAEDGRSSSHRSGAGVKAPPDLFRALGEAVLGASVAFLCPVGPLASLVGAPLAAPESAVPPEPDVLGALVKQIGSGHQLCLPIDPGVYNGAAWAVPLWGERNLIGLLLLGDRRDDSLYSQEEIEIARAAGERLIDARAAGELARRLLLLQRRRLSEDQVLDSRVRRVLHDDVLPLLHTALLSLGRRPSLPATPPTAAAQPAASTSDRAASSDEAAALLADAHRQISALLAELPPPLAPDVARIGLVRALQRVVEDLGGELDEVTWEIEPSAERALTALSPLAAEVLFGAAREAIRNAARHAHPADRERPVRLGITVAVTADDLTLHIEDDGVGLAARAGPRGDAGGAGQGLILHGTLLTVLGGSLVAEGAPGHGTRVTLRLPASDESLTAPAGSEGAWTG